MKIEFGFQSTCSELVSHLGMVSRDEVMKALRVIARITNMNWAIALRASIDGQERQKLVPVGDGELERIVTVVDSGYNLWQIDDDSVMDILSGISDQEIRAMKDIIAVAKDNLQHIKVVLCRPGHDTTEPPQQSGLSFSIYSDCEFCHRKGLSIRISNLEVEAMPEFHAIVSEFNSWFGGHDGGSADEFITWLVCQFIDKRKAERWNAELKEGKEEGEDSYPHLDNMERYPPIDRSKPLSDFELEEILRWGIL